MDIARVVGATDKKDGYCTGNGYMVTWALGHLVSLAMPGAYGYTKTSAENLPMLPDPFRLVSRQVRTDKGMVTDIAAAKQLKIIDSVFDRCDSIIVATDCAREGELIFRWIYSYLGYTKPFKRLWISSLTDEAIREGLANLRDGSDYDSLYAAADCRAKADWLVGMNASRALAGGTIDVTSGIDQGSTFRVTLPLKTTDETVESENLIIPHPAHLPRNVLVIDDDTMLLNVIKEMLERNGMNCTTCVTSKDVVKAMRGKDYDLLLSDIQMPGTNGIDLLTLLRNSNIGNSRTIPIVAMTARGDRDKEAFLHAGFTDYIYKPFSSSELLGLLSRMKTDRREKKPEVDFSLVLSEVNDKHKALLSLISQSEKDREELDAAMKNGDRHKLREITHRMQPMWEFLRMEEPLLAYRALLKDSKTSDKELKEYTRQIIDSTAMLIKAAEAEIKRLTNETEDTDS